MNAVSLGLVLTGMLLGAMAQLLLKAGTNAVGHFEFHWQNALPVTLKLATQPFLVAGIGCYGLSLVIWIMALSRVPVSVAYPMVALGYVINAVGAWLWLGESLGMQKLLGIGFIVLGVWLIARS
ncbi:MAG: SMR family transporter [Rhodocyclaceae bacterium]|jgi:multidrug transporter EmrE-like cation transporter|nr:SMR family transporter [Rhodocyclaceae bacterium]